MTDPNDLYGEYYYRTNCGPIPYERSEEHWGRFFGGVAECVLRQLRPTSALDVGCAKGFLVEALRERGVHAWGIDISDFAISSVEPSIKEYVAVTGIGKPLPEYFPQRYDLVCCVETLEHLAPAEVRPAVEWLCTLSNRVLFSSTPDDFKEATHFSVLPQEEWSALFAEFGFYRNFDIDVSALTPWAVLYERGTSMFSVVVRNFEREYLRADAERRALRDELVRRTHELSQMDAKIVSLERQTQEAFEARFEEARRERQPDFERELAGANERTADADARLAKGAAELERARDELARVKLDLLAERDRVIGALAEAEQSKRIATNAQRDLEQLAANQAPLVAAARQLEATLQSETWRIGTAVMAPVRWLRRLLGGSRP